MSGSEVVIRKMSQADNAEMSRLLGDVFSRRDPPAVATNFSPEKLQKVAALFGSKSAKEGLSSVAVDNTSGEIVGAILAHDFGRPPPVGLDAVDLSSEPVIALLEELESGFLKGQNVQPNKFLHVFMVAVSDDFSRQGIAKRLVEFCVRQAERSGYRIAFAEATNRFSQSLFLTAGFAKIFSIGYKDFELDGRLPFLSISDQGGCVLMKLHLSASLASSDG